MEKITIRAWWLSELKRGIDYYKKQGFLEEGTIIEKYNYFHQVMKREGEI